MGVQAGPTDTFEELANKILLIVPTVYGNIIVDVTNLEITEGGTSIFTVRLDQAPTKNQVINIASSNSKVIANPSALTFTPSNYNTTQTVTVSAENDAIEDNGYTLTLTLSSNNVEDVVINITVKDNDVIIEWHTATSDELTLQNELIQSYNGTETSVILPSTINVSGTDKTCKIWKFTVNNSNLQDLDLNNLEVFSPVQGIVTLKTPLRTLKNMNLTGCTSFPILKNLKNLPTFSNYTGTTMKSAFQGSLIEDASSLVIPSTVTNVTSLFQNVTTLKHGANISSDNIVSCDYVYYGCTALEDFTISSKVVEFFQNTTMSNTKNTPIGVKAKLYSDSAAFAKLKSSTCLLDGQLDNIDVEFLDATTSLVKIACFGDSLTYGTTGSTESDSYPYHLNQKLPSNAIVYNIAAGGITVQKISEYVTTYNCHTNDINVIWGGTNNTPEIADHISQTNEIISKLQSDKYIIVGLANKGYSSERDATFETEYGDKFLSIVDYFTNNGYTLSDYLLSDSVHLNEDGKEIVAQAVYDKIISLGYITT